MTTIIAAVSVVIAAMSLLLSYLKVSKFESNCIATMNIRLDSVEKRMDLLKPDAVIEKLNHIKEQLKNGSEAFSRMDNRLDDFDKRMTTAEAHTESYLERQRTLYGKIDKFVIEVNRRLEERGNK